MLNEFEEQYLGVLQNIEFGIVRIFREQSELMDWDVLQTLDALIKVYKAESANHAEPVLALNELRQKLFDSVKAMCDLNLDRSTLSDQNGNPLQMRVNPLSLDEILQCLKRIRRSVETWNKKNGRQGYLNFIVEFVH